MSLSSPALISVDWGTSSFRAYLADAAGRTLAEILAAAGSLSLNAGEHEPYVTGLLTEWRRLHPGIPIVASGMVGARQGWVEAPYAPCPAGAAEIAGATLLAPSPALGGVRIIPGVSALDSRGAPDVMRGEETQILGALAASGARDGLFVLPGTHSKWARVEAGRIVDFQTFMTGEIFALLKAHSVLGRMMSPPTENEPDTGFETGLDAAAALEHPGDLLHAAFMTRTFALFGRLAPGQLAEYLSGLLIGAEMLAGARGARSAIVIGAPSLVERYARAGERLGIGLTRAPDNCATLGQIEVLRRLGAL